MSKPRAPKDAISNEVMVVVVLDQTGAPGVCIGKAAKNDQPPGTTINKVQP